MFLLVRTEHDTIVSAKFNLLLKQISHIAYLLCDPDVLLLNVDPQQDSTDSMAFHELTRISGGELFAVLKPSHVPW